MQFSHSLDEIDLRVAANGVKWIPPNAKHLIDILHRLYTHKTKKMLFKPKKLFIYIFVEFQHFLNERKSVMNAHIFRACDNRKKKADRVIAIYSIRSPPPLRTHFVHSSFDLRAPREVTK